MQCYLIILDLFSLADLGRSCAPEVLCLFVQPSSQNITRERVNKQVERLYIMPFGGHLEAAYSLFILFHAIIKN